MDRLSKMPWFHPIPLTGPLPDPATSIEVYENSNNPSENVEGQRILACGHSSAVVRRRLAQITLALGEML